MNWGRIVLGGLAAGFVMNLMEAVVGGMLLRMDRMWDEALRALGKPMSTDAAAVTFFVGLYFVMGICGAWLYAAIRPRFGAGPKTAIIAGVALWLFAMALPESVNAVLGLFPTRLIAMFVALSLVEFLAGIYVAAWIYKEKGDQSVRSARV
jgi:hypothetical protein